MTMYCSYCQRSVESAPSSAARSTPEQCPHCKMHGVTWTSWKAGAFDQRLTASHGKGTATFTWC